MILPGLTVMVGSGKMWLGGLSERVGRVQDVDLSKFKTGKISAIRFSTLNAICSALDCQPGDILEYRREETEEK